jgi:hypothetical protein
MGVKQFWQIRFITMLKVVPTVAIRKFNAYQALWEWRLAATSKLQEETCRGKTPLPHQIMPTENF